MYETWINNFVNAVEYQKTGVYVNVNENNYIIKQHK